MTLRDRLGEWWLHWRYGVCTDYDAHFPLRGWVDEAHRIAEIQFRLVKPSPPETEGDCPEGCQRHLTCREAGELTPEMIRAGLDALWKGGPVRPDPGYLLEESLPPPIMKWAQLDADVIGDIREAMDSARVWGQFEPLWKTCPYHGVVMIYHPAGDDWACTYPGCRYYHGMKAAQ